MPRSTCCSISAATTRRAIQQTTIAIWSRSRAGTAELARAGLLDIMSSDYMPASLLMAAFRLPAAVPAISLPEAIRTVTKAPAAAVGLDDRGEIAVGKRADLVRVRVTENIPVVRFVWRTGERVA